MVDSNPFFSVIIPSYNRSTQVMNAVKSVLNQSCENFEIIIINDCSKTDYSKIEKYIKHFKNVKYIKKQKNEHISSARNTGIEYSKGVYIAFLDDDDIFYPNHLSIIYDKIQSLGKENITPKILYSRSYIYNQNKTIKEPSIMIDSKFEQFAPSSMVVHKDVFKNFGGFNTKLKYAEDLEFIYRCYYAHLQFYPTNKFTIKQFFNNDNMSGTNINITNAISALTQIKTNLLPFGESDYINNKLVNLKLTELNNIASQKKIPLYCYLIIKLLITKPKLMVNKQIWGTFKLFFK